MSIAPQFARIAEALSGTPRSTTAAPIGSSGAAPISANNQPIVPLVLTRYRLDPQRLTLPRRRLCRR